MDLGQYIHPEFGYFSPTPRLRRDVRVGFFALVSGVVIGAISVIAMVATHREVQTASAAGAVSVPAATQPGSNSAQRYADLVAPEFNNSGGSGTRQAEASSNATDPSRVQTLASEQPGANISDRCEGPSSLYAKRSCLSKKRRALASPVDNGPPIARVPLGHSAPLEETAPAGAHPVMSETAQLSPSSHTAHTPGDAPQPANAKDAPRDRSHSVRGSQKKSLATASDNKPRKIAAAQNRQRNEASARAAPIDRGAETGFGGFGRVYARDNSSARTVFWDWSR